MKIVTILVLSLMVAVIPALAGTQVLPHLAVGGGYESTVTLTNQMTDEAQFIYIQLYTDTGQQWRVDSDNVHLSRFNFNLEPGESVSLTFTGTPETVETGWAMVVDRGPAMVSAGYSFVSSSEQVMTGVLPERPDVLSFVPASIDVADRIDTGVAIANPSGTAGDATIQLLDESGALKASRTIPVGAMGRFVGLLTAASLFPEADGIKGFLRIETDHPMAVMALSTRGNLFTSLPAVHDVIPWRNDHTVFVSPLLGSDPMGDGSLAKPFKTIQKAQLAGDRGWTVYLLPGLYDAQSGQAFPIRLSDCILIRGADPESVCISGSGPWGSDGVNAAVVGAEYKGMLTGVTVTNPVATGIYTINSVYLNNCRVVNCGGTGIDLSEGDAILSDNVVTGNAIGVHVGPTARPDMGGGVQFSTGGNFFIGNFQCDLTIEPNPSCASCFRSFRFNVWDSAVPVVGTQCAGGADIVVPAGTVVNY